MWQAIKEGRGIFFATGFRPDRYDIAGAAICLVGVATIMYAPRWNSDPGLAAAALIVAASAAVGAVQVRVSHALTSSSASVLT